MGKKKEIDDIEDEDEEDANFPFNLMDFFKDPTKVFQNKQFKQMFEGIFEKITENFPNLKGLNPEDITKEMMKNKGKFGSGPFMYGVNVNIGPDGKPIVGSFGNIKTKPHGKPEVQDVREPLIEVYEEAEQIIVIAEIPGITKEEIEIKATTQSLTISTKSGNMGKNFYKEIDMPAPINSDYAKARYQNGILEIKLKKLDEKQTNIKID